MLGKKGKKCVKTASLNLKKIRQEEFQEACNKYFNILGTKFVNCIMANTVSGILQTLYIRSLLLIHVGQKKITK